jgi:hypothetical protein
LGGIDEQLAALFCDMRLCLGASKAELARRLRTTPGVIEILESGQLHRLPPWPETVRLIGAFGALHGVDVRPILDRIRQQTGPAGLGRVPGSDGAMPRIARPQAAGERGYWRLGRQAARETVPRPAPERAAARRRKKRVVRALFTLTAPVVLAVAGLSVAQLPPSALLAATSFLPGPVARIVQPAVDYLAVKMAPVRDGLQWIEVGDPRTRKADKLRQAAH